MRVGSMMQLRWPALMAACILAAPNAFAVLGGSAAAENWFIRPQSVCPVEGNGLAYNCAATPGAAGAFNTFFHTDLWTATTGVDDGDTFYICGELGVPERRNATAEIDFNGSGSAGSVITLDGDCTAFGGTAMATLSGDAALDFSTDSTTNYGILIDNAAEEYITIKNIKFRRFDNNLQLGNTASSTTHRGLVLNNIISEYAFAQCMNIAPTAGIITNMTVRDCGEDGTYVYDGSADFSSLTVTGFTCERVDQKLGGIADCFKVERADDTNSFITLSDFYMYKTGLNKSALLLNVGGVCTVFDGELEGAPTGQDSSGISIDGCGSGNIWGIKIHGFERAGISRNSGLGAQTTGTLNIFAIEAYDNADSIQLNGTHSGSFVIANNSLSSTGKGIEQQSAFSPGSITIVNNAISTTGDYSMHVSSAASLVTHTYSGNRYLSNATFLWDGNPEASYASWAAASGETSSSVISSMGFVSDTDLRTVGNSVLRRTGVMVPGLRACGFQDFRGRPAWCPPDIGAFQSSSGDPANTRTAATTRNKASTRSKATTRTKR